MSWAVCGDGVCDCNTHTPTIELTAEISTPRHGRGSQKKEKRTGRQAGRSSMCTGRLAVSERREGVQASLTMMKIHCVANNANLSLYTTHKILSGCTRKLNKPRSHISIIFDSFFSGLPEYAYRIYVCEK